MVASFYHPKVCLLANKHVEHRTYHLFGMLFAEGCLVCDIKHGDGALLTICKPGCAASKELLRAIQQNVWRKQ